MATESCELSKDHHKDSCGYSVDVSKLFFALASAGVAFVVTDFQKNGTTTYINYAQLVLLVISIISGLVLLMNIVALINQCNNYNVFSKSARILSSIQILSYLLAIVLVVVGLFWPKSEHVKMQTVILTNETQLTINDLDKVDSLIYKVNDREIHIFKSK